MPEPIKIILQVENEEAAKKLKEFAEQEEISFKRAGAAAKESGGEFGKNRIAMMELGHVARATGESLAFGMNPLRVLALESPRILQALTFMGIGFGALIPYVAAVGAAVGAGYIGWTLYMDGLEDTTTKTKELIDALEKVPGILDKINAMQKAGLVSRAAGTEFADYLNGRKKLYVGPDGNVTTAATHQETVMRPYYGGAGYAGLGQSQAVANREATQKEINDYVTEQLPKVSEAQTKAVNELRELQRKAHLENLEGLDKEIAKIHERYEKQRQEILETAQKAGNLIGPRQLDAATNGAVAELNSGEQKEVNRLREADAVKRAAAELEIQKLIDENFADEMRFEKELQAEDLKRLRMKQEIARAELEAQLQQIRGNAFLTQSQRTAQEIPVMQQLQIRNLQRIAELTEIINTTGDETARLQAERERVDLLRQNADLQNSIAEKEHPWATTFAELESQAELSARNIAATFSNVFNGVVNSISAGITGLIMGTMTWAQFLAQIPRQILTQIVGAIVQMGVRWIATQILMAVAGKAIMASALAASAPIAAAAMALWGPPAVAASIATGGGATGAGLFAFKTAEITSALLPGFADGGRPNVGELAIVGERGPELFVPDVPGTIVPNNKLDQINRGSGAAAGSPNAGGKTEVLFFMDKQDLLNHFKSSDAEKIVVAHVMNNRMKLGIQS